MHTKLGRNIGKRRLSNYLNFALKLSNRTRPPHLIVFGEVGLASIATLNSYDILGRMYIRKKIMRISKWGNSLAVRLRKSLVENLGLKSGDELEIVWAKPTRITVARDERRERAVERMRNRALDLPKDYAFDRNEASTR